MNKSILKKAILVIATIAILIVLYLNFGHVVFNQIHVIDQEVEHSMDGVDGIKIISQLSDIEVFTADYEDFYATFTGRVQSPSKDAVPFLKASLEGTILTIEINSSNKDIRAMEDMQFNIYLPSDYHERFEILSNDGRIELPSLNLSTLSCVSSTGDISTKRLEANAIVLSTISGKLDCVLSLETAEAITVDTMSGHINSDYKTGPNSPYKFLTTTGDITIKHK